jgi:ribose transport system permease protein
MSQGKVIQLLREALDKNLYAAFAFIVLVVLVIVNYVLDSSMFSTTGLVQAIDTAAPLILLAIAVTPSIFSGHGGIDLSLGPLAGLITVLAGTYLNTGTLGSPFVLIPVALLLGIALGALNGVAVTRFRIQPIVATLGTYLIVTGIGAHFAPGAGGNVSGWVKGLSNSPLVVLMIVLVMAVWYLITKTRYYRWLRAVGYDDRSAYIAGVPVDTVRFTAYVIGGLFAGVAGLALTILIGGSDSTVGPSYTLVSIAAVALGGVSLAGGRGGIFGSIVGALDIFLIENLLTLANVSVFAFNLAYGAILVAMVIINVLISNRRLRFSTSKMTG